MLARLLIAFAILGWIEQAFACSCAGPGPPAREFAQSSAVFRGRVVEMDFMVVKMSVGKSWKGVRTPTVTVRTDDGCGYHGFARDREFLVYAHGATLQASMCGRTKPAADAQLEMMLLDTVAQGGQEETFMRRLPTLLDTDSRPSARAEAARLMSRDAPKELATAALPALIKALGDEERIVREAVIRALESGPWIWVNESTPLIAKALISAISDREPSVRAEAARLLARYPTVEATAPALEARLKIEKDRSVISALSSTLAAIGSRKSKRAVIPLLIADLKSADVGTRRNAAEKLGAIGRDASAAVAPLVETLSDADQYARSTSAESLGAIGSEDAIPALIATLRDKEPLVRAAAAHAIHKIGDERALREHAVPALIAGLAEKDFGRYHIIRIVGELGPSAYRAVPALARALKESRGYEVYGLAEALGKIGPRAKAGVSELIAALATADDSGRTAIVHALKQIDDRSPRVVQALESALGNANRDVKFAAAGTLVEWDVDSGRDFAHKQIVPTLIEELKSPKLETRRQAANLLANWGADAAAAIPSLTRRLGDSDHWVRSYSATALGAIGPEAAGAVRPLTTMLDRKEGRREAAVALGAIGPPAADAVPRLIALLTDPEPWTRYCAAEALRKIGTAEARRAFEAFAAIEVPRLVEWLRDEERKDRGEAARYLVHLAPMSRTAIDPLIEALADSDWLTRTKAAESLAALGGEAERAVPKLIEALDDPDAYVRAAAARALERIGSSRATRALAEFRSIPK